jgi:hypothetical protein
MNEQQVFRGQTGGNDSRPNESRLPGNRKNKEFSGRPDRLPIKRNGENNGTE